ncbi:S8 family serine peptidase [Bacillus salitolerans]|uniref:S8 family serine peptidase n=1 Tax=Bacillus salitolerans TaxID=1437434 RepID=A0ABW4LRR0_9BACI
MKQLRLLLFILLFFSLTFQIVEANNEEKEWILYFQNKAQMKEVQSFIGEGYLNEHELMAKALLSDAEQSYIKNRFNITIEPNFQKRAALDATFNDPKLSEQWGISHIDVEKVWQKQPSLTNKLKGKTIQFDTKVATTYNETLNAFQRATIQVNKEKLSRISVSADHVEQEWGIEVYGDGKRLAGNTGNLQKLDVLLDKTIAYSKLEIVITGTESWQVKPLFHIVGVNHFVVAVIDSGITVHEDFCDNILYSLSVDYKEKLPYGEDRFGHGTHVTGILAACSNNGVGYSGVLGKAGIDILPLKVLDRYGNGGDFEVSKAVLDAVSMKVDVINMSLAGRGETKMLREAVISGLKQNIPIVAAAGNWNMSTENIYPASYPGVITVAASDNRKGIISISNYGWEVDLSAPGDYMNSAYLNNEYRSLRGTSMATPYVTGAVALLKVTYPTISLPEIRDRLISTSMDIKTKGYDIQSGSGVLQINSAIQASSTSGLDWYTLKEGQMISTKETHVLGVSNKWIGHSLLIYADTTLLYQGSIENNWVEFNFKDFPITKDSIRLSAIVFDRSHSIISNESLLVKAEATKRVPFSFTDINTDHWAFADISEAYDRYYVNGFGDGTFSPEGNISRRHSVMMLSRLFDWNTPSSFKGPFTDISFDLPGSLAIFSAYEKGVINGYADRSFRPDEKLTRAQMALILARALDLAETPFNKTPFEFSDIVKEHQAYNSIQHLVDIGIITKQENYRPTDYITRAQFTAMLMRTHRYFNQ